MQFWIGKSYRKGSLGEALEVESKEMNPSCSKLNINPLKKIQITCEKYKYLYRKLTKFP